MLQTCSAGMAGTGWDQVGVVRVLLFVHCNYADWDLEVCLNYECRRKQIRKPSYFNQWIDVRATYKVHTCVHVIAVEHFMLHFNMACLQISPSPTIKLKETCIMYN